MGVILSNREHIVLVTEERGLCEGVGFEYVRNQYAFVVRWVTRNSSANYRRRFNIRATVRTSKVYRPRLVRFAELPWRRSGENRHFGPAKRIRDLGRKRQARPSLRESFE